MIEDGRLDVEEFLTMTPVSTTANPMATLRTSKDVRKAFDGYEDNNVGVRCVVSCCVVLGVGGGGFLRRAVYTFRRNSGCWGGRRCSLRGAVLLRFNQKLRSSVSLWCDDVRPGSILLASTCGWSAVPTSDPIIYSGSDLTLFFTKQ